MPARTGQAGACAECQRRKQRCNRTFPCNQCTKRGVAHLCLSVFKPVATETIESDSSVQNVPSQVSRKRNLDEAVENTPSEEPYGYEIGNASFDASDALNALGYMPHTHHLVLGRGNGPQTSSGATDEDGEMEPSTEVKAALEQMPRKPHADFLVDNWLNGANHHYCALYPQEFRTQYDGWWNTPANRTPELTSLILRVFACSALFIVDDRMKRLIESEMKVDAIAFAQRMHKAAQKLGSSITHGKGGLLHVQQLFLTAFWLKSAEKWTESWYALGEAIRAAYEIGLHQDSTSAGMSEFDREMRRRLWSVLYLWDFALSSMVSRPMLVNRADCAFEMPTLALEIDPEQPYQPSPFRHMKLHCQLCIDLSKGIASVPTEKAATDLAPRLRGIVEKWFNSLPAEYSLKAPDTRWDDDHEWVVFQRRYLHLIGYMSLFGPLKPYVIWNSSKPMSEVGIQLRSRGVEAALGLMDISWSFFENVASVGAKFHYAVFCIFDTTTVLCSAFVHDEARSLPQREVILEAVKKGLGMLERLRSVSKTTADLCRILKTLLEGLPLNSIEKALIGVAKRIKSKAPSTTIMATQSTPQSPPGSDSLASPPSTVATQARSWNSTASESEYPASVGLEQNRSPAGAATARSQPLSAIPSPEASTSSIDASQHRKLLPRAEDSPDRESSQPNGVYLDEAFSHDDGINRNVFHAGITPGCSSANNSGLPSMAGELQEIQFSDFQPVVFDIALGHSEWHHSGQGVNLDVAQNTNLVEFDPTMPTLLEYWDWQGLDLGHPGFWEVQQPLPPL
ncbi:hypothetical protein OQA88_3606 [Cercophora sp. LCS_1]